MKAHFPATHPRRDTCRHAPGALCAFTLIELLAIVCMAALLMSIMASGLTKTNQEGKSTRCINNHRQLMTAWRMYAADNAEHVIYNFPIPAIENETTNQTYRNWANNIMSWDLNWTTTNLALLQRGILAPYFGNNTSLYKCPADNFLSWPQTSAGWTARTRSISMNGFFGPFSFDGSDATFSERNWFYSVYRQCLRLSQVQEPANTYVLLEEHPDSINDGIFINDYIQNSWGDLPGSLHDGGCTVGFADGHVELHRWLSNTSKYPVRFYYSTRVFDSLGRMDYQWLSSRMGAVPYR